MGAAGAKPARIGGGGGALRISTQVKRTSPAQFQTFLLALALLLIRVSTGHAQQAKGEGRALVLDAPRAHAVYGKAGTPLVEPWGKRKASGQAPAP